jgi:hypothetical protein
VIITNDFVLVHIPKTAGTALRRNLREAYTSGPIDAALHRLRRKFGMQIPFHHYGYKELEQHTLRRLIPPEFKALPLLTSIREPISHYVSYYRFQLWRERPFLLFDPSITSHYSHFPNLSFDEFVVALNTHSEWIVKHGDHGLGFFSTVLLYYLVDDRSAYYGETDELSKRFKRDVEGVYWLRQENLDEDLDRFLAVHGRHAKRLNYPSKHRRFNVSSRPSPEVSKEMRDYIYKKEAFLASAYDWVRARHAETTTRAVESTRA